MVQDTQHSVHSGLVRKLEKNFYRIILKYVTTQLEKKGKIMCTLLIQNLKNMFVGNIIIYVNKKLI